LVSTEKGSFAFLSVISRDCSVIQWCVFFSTAWTSVLFDFSPFFLCFQGVLCFFLVFCVFLHFSALPHFSPPSQAFSNTSLFCEFHEDGAMGNQSGVNSVINRARQQKWGELKGGI
jgi:hypothetical protein